jgi:predicted HTH domain antitoxin
MCELTVTVPDGRLSALNVPPEQAAEEVRMLAAVKLYEMGRLSSGAAAEFAGVPKPVFLERLGGYGVPTFRQTQDELREEMRNA